MSQTPCNRSDCLVPLRWRCPGHDLSRPNNVDQCADRPVIRPEHLSKCPRYSGDLPRLPTHRRRRAAVPLPTDLAAYIEPP